MQPKNTIIAVRPEPQSTFLTPRSHDLMEPLELVKTSQNRQRQRKRMLINDWKENLYALSNGHKEVGTNLKKDKTDI